MTKLPAVDRVRELLSYDPATGIFTRKIKAGNQRAGAVAGSMRPDGYCRIHIDNRDYLSHRLAWLIVYGKNPGIVVDHIDRDPTNNRITNLRVSTPGQNQINSKLRSDSSSGETGVTWDKAKNSYKAQIVVSGKNKHLGNFKNIEDAVACRRAASIKYYGEFVPLEIGLGRTS